MKFLYFEIPVALLWGSAVAIILNTFEANVEIRYLEDSYYEYSTEP